MLCSALRHCVSARGSLLQSIHQTGDSVFDQHLPDVDQQPKAFVSETNVGDDLFLVNGIGLLDGFQFDNDLVVHDEVGAKAFVKGHVLESNEDRDLSLNSQPSPFQKFRQYGLVNRFQQSGAKLSVNLVRAINNDFGDLVFTHRTRSISREDAKTQRKRRQDDTHPLQNLCAFAPLREDISA